LLRFSRPLLPPEQHTKRTKGKNEFRSKGSQEGQAASLADTAAGTPPLSLRPLEACPLSRLVERAETRAEGGVPAGNEAVRGAGPGVRGGRGAVESGRAASGSYRKSGVSGRNPSSWASVQANESF